MDLTLGTGSDRGSEPSSSASVERTNASRELETLERDLVDARARIAELESGLASQGRARAELVHLVSHELRTPITVISGFGRLLQSESHGKLESEQARFVEECLKACRRLDRFVGDLLEACPDSGTPLSVEIGEANLDAVIRGLLESLAPLLDERSQRIETKLGGGDRLCFDVRRIEQVVTNLMTNAVRYGRQGGLIRVSTEPLLESELGPCVRISIDDDGPGIAPADRERLFQPYVRGETPGEENGGCAGLGIGLAICRRIIESHRGLIRVEESDLGGARFVVMLPSERSSSGGAE